MQTFRLRAVRDFGMPSVPDTPGRRRAAARPVGSRASRRDARYQPGGLWNVPCASVSGFGK